MTTPVGAVASDANATAKSSPKGGSIFTKKYGPLPGWAWAGIIAGGTLGFLVWRAHEKAKSATATTAASTASTTGTGTGYGASLATIQSEVQQLQGQQAATTTAKTTAAATGAKTTSTTAPTTVGPQVTVPNVVGQRANFAIGELDSLGLKYTSATGDRNPASEYTTTAQSPKAGTKVAKGSSVTLSFKVI